MSGPKGKDSRFSRSGDFWHFLFRDEVKGGILQLNYKDGKDHITVRGEGAHFSWDVDPQKAMSPVSMVGSITLKDRGRKCQN